MDLDMDFCIILVPTSRMVTKRILDIFGLWSRETWIMGSGINAHEAYKAINSERNLGLNVVGFINSSEENTLEKSINGIPILPNDLNWLLTKDKKTQFIVAVESIKVI
jgi:undecaprenyl-phosphate galactose phosphotransferase